MEIDLDSIEPTERYRLLTSVIVPRPIAWVTTVDGQGRLNAAPFSFFNVFGSRPPLVVLGIGNRPDTGEPKDTVLNIRSSGEFVINLVSKPLAKAMVATAATLPHGTNELSAVGLASSPSQTVTPPRIAESPVSLECHLHSIQEIGANRLIIATVLHAHIADAYYNRETGAIDTTALELVGRMHGPDGYLDTSNQFQINRPD